MLHKVIAEEFEVKVDNEVFKFPKDDIAKALNSIKNTDLCLILASKVFYKYQATTIDSKKIENYFDQTVAKLKSLIPEKQNDIDYFGLGVFETLCRRVIAKELSLDDTMQKLLKKVPGDYKAIGDDLAFWKIYAFLHEYNREDLINLLARR